MHKPHPTPVDLSFIRGKEQGQDYTSPDYYIQFDYNSITIKPILLTWPESTIDDLLFLFKSQLRKYKGKHFHKLHLCLYECRKLNRNKLHEIGLEIASHFKNLRELTLQFFQCEGLTGEGLRYLLSPLSKSLKSLEKLNISIGCCNGLDDKGINALRFLILQRLTKLKKLTLNFSPDGTLLRSGEDVSFDPNFVNRLNKFIYHMDHRGIQNEGQVTSNGLYLLCNALTRYLKIKLKEFVLVLPMTKNYDSIKTVASKKKIVQDLKGLTKLYLNFETFRSQTRETRETDKRVDEIASITLNISQHLLDLQYLALEIACSQFAGNLVMKKIGSIFSNLPLLRGLSLFCDRGGVTDDGIKSLTSDLAKSDLKLEDLALGFEFMSLITDKAIQSIISYLNKSSRSLKRLTLDFKNTQASGYDIQTLSEPACQNIEMLSLYLPKPNLGINTYFKNLKVLVLSFDSCQKMTDSDFEFLVQNIFSWHLQGLDEFALSIQCADELTDLGLQALWCQDWTQFTNLKVLTLEFYFCESLTDISQEFISLKNLKNLHSLTIIFRECLTTLSDAEFLILRISKHLKQLESLCIDFFDYKEPKDDIDKLYGMIDHICKSLRALRTLKLKLGVSFQGDGRGGNIIREVLKKLAYIPSVSFY